MISRDYVFDNFDKKQNKALLGTIWNNFWLLKFLISNGQVETLVFVYEQINFGLSTLLILTWEFEEYFSIHCSYKYDFLKNWNNTSLNFKDTIFPKIFICANSPHSKRKLSMYYPYVTEDLLNAFYNEMKGMFFDIV